MSNYEQIAKTALCYCICVDIARAALSALGSVNTTDPSKVTVVSYNEMVKAAQREKGGK